MKIGIKIYSPDQISILDKNNIKAKIDFVEVMAVRSYDFSFLDKIDMPLVIHAEHSEFNVNLSDKNKESSNQKSLTFARQLADKYNATYIVVHPGYMKNVDCTENQIIKILSSHDDKRVLIENMPYRIQETQFFGYDKKTLGRISKLTNKNVCIDIGHATLAALKLEKNPLEFFNELLRLNVKHFHIADVKHKSFNDHLHLKDGDNLEEMFLSNIPDNSSITIETSKDIIPKVVEDIDYLRKIINLHPITPHNGLHKKASNVF